MMNTDEITADTRARSIEWYRTPVEQSELRILYARSDLKGLAQALGYLVLLLVTGGTSLYSFYHWPWWTTLLLVFLHGTCYGFGINAVHETGHNTVFKSKWLNVMFVHIFAFLGLINHRMFETSHVRHHRSTLHPPDDLEVVVPIKITLKDFLLYGFVNFRGPAHVFKFHYRVARGVFVGEWEVKLFPESNPERRRWASQWAQTVLLGHAAIVVIALAFKLWMIPVLVTFAPFYGGWLFFLCNSTQHVGLQDNVSDYRLNTRTFTLNPIVRFLYWQMNYHVEHHMYPGVPCYNLGRLHRLIKHDLPLVPNGILETWLEINRVLKIEASKPPAGG